MGDKHLLVAVNDDRSCHDGLKFVGGFFNDWENTKVTLLYVAPAVVQACSQAFLASSWEGGNDEGTGENISDAARRTMSVCSRYIQKLGVPEENISREVISKKSCRTSDIVSFARKGLYDALVLGKRSTSMIEKMIMGSVAEELLEKDIEFPLWFCREPDEARKGVLICADGSESTLRVADHVGYILKDGGDHDVTLLHIDKGQGVDQEKLFAELSSRLVASGLPAERIRTKVKQAKRVVRAIEKEVDESGYAAVAVGWIGRTKRSGLSSMFMGDKSKELMKDLSKTALWVVK